MKKIIKIKSLKWFKENCDHIERGYLVYKNKDNPPNYWFNNKMRPFCDNKLEVNYIKSENVWEYREGIMVIWFEDWMIEKIY